MQIDTLVPQTVISAGTWQPADDCASPGVVLDNLAEVTSDDDDNTFARLLSGGALDSNTLELSLGTHTEPADHQRHLVRIRSRWVKTGLPSNQARIRGARVNTPAGGFFTFADLTTTINSAPICEYQERATAWSAAGITAQVAVDFLYLVNLAVAGVAAAVELKMDIDNRHKPDFTAEVLDGSGASAGGGTITDTTTPTFVFAGIDFDGLNARSWQIYLYTLAETMAGGFAPFDPAFTTVDEFEGNGAPPTQVIGQPIPNGDYVAYFRAFSTIRVNDAFTSDIESVAFEMDVTPPAAPDLVTTYDSAADLVEVCFDPPAPESGSVEFDEGLVVTEIQRSDCDSGGFVTVAVLEATDDCWDDCIFPYAKTGGCGIEDHDCVLTYRARYWGLVDGILMATDWSATDTVEVAWPFGENDRIRTFGCDTVEICPTRSWTRSRPFGRFQPISGGHPTVVTGTPGGRDYTLVFPVRNADLAAVEAVLAEMVVHYAPSDLPAQWMAPNTETITVLKVGRIREFTVSFVATLPPVVATPESFFS